MYNAYAEFEQDQLNKLEGKFSGSQIRFFRIRKDLTLVQLAEKIGVHYQTLQKWENGINSPSVEYLFQLAKVLDVHMVEFFI